MAEAKATALSEVFSIAGLLGQLARYFHHTRKLETLDHFLNCVVRKDFEAELRVFVAEAFPVKEEFTIEEQRLYVLAREVLTELLWRRKLPSSSMGTGPEDSPS